MSGQFFLGDMVCDSRTQCEKPTAIRLSSFNVTQQDGQNLIIWITSAEIDTEGFHILRSTKRDSLYQRITIDRGDFLFIWEPRGEWNSEEVYQLCKELRLTPCLDPFKPAIADYGDICYLRLHGIGGYRYHYSEDDLLKILKGLKTFPGVLLLTVCSITSPCSMTQDGLRPYPLHPEEPFELLRLPLIGSTEDLVDRIS